MPELKITADSKIAKMMREWCKDDWIAYITKTKAAGIQSNDLIIKTSDDGSSLILIAKDEETLSKGMKLMGEVEEEKGEK